MIKSGLHRKNAVIPYWTSCGNRVRHGDSSILKRIDFCGQTRRLSFKYTVLHSLNLSQMSKETRKMQNTRQPGSIGKTPPPALIQVPPLFRKIDWLALIITFAVIWTVYFLTLAPEQTLEDSGELCTGSFYAGIPHPPGYPFWAIYSWLWTKLLLVGNVAWRVEVGEATAAALACGLIAFMVSRGSSMLMEGIEELRNITGKWENIICLVSGTVAGLLLGLGGVMWSESVAINRISPFGVPGAETEHLGARRRGDLDAARSPPAALVVPFTASSWS